MIFGPKTLAGSRSGGGACGCDAHELRELAEAVGVDSATTATRPTGRGELRLSSGLRTDAPADAIANEAAIRTTGWLAEQPSAAITSETEGDIRTSYAPSMHDPRCGIPGAMALLSPWKVRRAGAI